MHTRTSSHTKRPQHPLSPSLSSPGPTLSLSAFVEFLVGTIREHLPIRFSADLQEFKRICEASSYTLDQQIKALIPIFYEGFNTTQGRKKFFINALSELLVLYYQKQLKYKRKDSSAHTIQATVEKFITQTASSPFREHVLQRFYELNQNINVFDNYQSYFLESMRESFYRLPQSSLTEEMKEKDLLQSNWLKLIQDNATEKSFLEQEDTTQTIKKLLQDKLGIDNYQKLVETFPPSLPHLVLSEFIIKLSFQLKAPNFFSTFLPPAALALIPNLPTMSPHLIPFVYSVESLDIEAREDSLLLGMVTILDGIGFQYQNVPVQLSSGFPLRLKLSGKIRAEFKLDEPTKSWQLQTLTVEGEDSAAITQMLRNSQEQAFENLMLPLDLRISQVQQVLNTFYEELSDTSPLRQHIAKIDTENQLTRKCSDTLSSQEEIEGFCKALQKLCHPFELIRETDKDCANHVQFLYHMYLSIYHFSKVQVREFNLAQSTTFLDIENALIRLCTIEPIYLQNAFDSVKEILEKPQITSNLARHLKHKSWDLYALSKSFSKVRLAEDTRKQTPRLFRNLFSPTALAAISPSKSNPSERLLDFEKMIADSEAIERFDRSIFLLLELKAKTLLTPLSEKGCIAKNLSGQKGEEVIHELIDFITGNVNNLLKVAQRLAPENTAPIFWESFKRGLIRYYKNQLATVENRTNSVSYSYHADFLYLQAAAEVLKQGQFIPEEETASCASLSIKQPLVFSLDQETHNALARHFYAVYFYPVERFLKACLERHPLDNKLIVQRLVDGLEYCPGRLKFIQNELLSASSNAASTPEDFASLFDAGLASILNAEITSALAKAQNFKIHLHNKQHKRDEVFAKIIEKISLRTDKEAAWPSENNSAAVFSPFSPTESQSTAAPALVTAFQRSQADHSKFPDDLSETAESFVTAEEYDEKVAFSPGAFTSATATIGPSFSPLTQQQSPLRKEEDSALRLSPSSLALEVGKRLTDPFNSPTNALEQTRQKTFLKLKSLKKSLKEKAEEITEMLLKLRVDSSLPDFLTPKQILETITLLLANPITAEGYENYKNLVEKALEKGGQSSWKYLLEVSERLEESFQKSHVLEAELEWKCASIHDDSILEKELENIQIDLRLISNWHRDHGFLVNLPQADWEVVSFKTFELERSPWAKRTKKNKHAELILQSANAFWKQKDKFKQLIDLFFTINAMAADTPQEINQIINTLNNSLQAFTEDEKLNIAQVIVLGAVHRLTTNEAPREINQLISYARKITLGAQRSEEDESAFKEASCFEEKLFDTVKEKLLKFKLLAQSRQTQVMQDCFSEGYQMLGNENGFRVDWPRLAAIIKNSAYKQNNHGAMEEKESLHGLISLLGEDYNHFKSHFHQALLNILKLWLVGLGIAIKEGIKNDLFGGPTTPTLQDWEAAFPFFIISQIEYIKPKQLKLSAFVDGLHYRNQSAPTWLRFRCQYVVHATWEMIPQFGFKLKEFVLEGPDKMLAEEILNAGPDANIPFSLDNRLPELNQVFETYRTDIENYREHLTLFERLTSLLDQAKSQQQEFTCSLDLNRTLYAIFTEEVWATLQDLPAHLELQDNQKNKIAFILLKFSEAIFSFSEIMAQSYGLDSPEYHLKQQGLKQLERLDLPSAFYCRLISHVISQLPDTGIKDLNYQAQRLEEAYQQGQTLNHLLSEQGTASTAKSFITAFKVYLDQKPIKPIWTDRELETLWQKHCGTFMSASSCPLTRITLESVSPASISANTPDIT